MINRFLFLKFKKYKSLFFKKNKKSSPFPKLFCLVEKMVQNKMLHGLLYFVEASMDDIRKPVFERTPI